jgi:metal-responsive CopG/Arc/MetJ family transcriptional regulator
MNSAGRPAVGIPINVRLGDDLLAQVDAYAESEGIKRAEAIRRLVARGLRRGRSKR